MRYFIRAVKYFIYFTLLFIVIMAILVLTGAAEGDISTMFKGGYSALWKIALIFAVISAIYPSVGFIRKEAMIPGRRGQGCNQGIHGRKGIYPRIGGYRNNVFPEERDRQIHQDV